MKALLTVIALLLFSLAAQAGNKKLKGKPKTLEETFAYLNEIFDNDTALYAFKEKHEYYLYFYHMGLGMWMRNNWGLWRNSDLKQWFTKQGIIHPDDMSSIILTSYHRYLNNKPVDVPGQLKKQAVIRNGVADGTNGFYYTADLTKNKPAAEELLRRYHTGDTVQFSVYATTGKFAASLRAIGVILGFDSTDAHVQILNLEQRKKTTSTRKPGDVVHEHLAHVAHLPPKGWKRR